MTPSNNARLRILFPIVFVSAIAGLWAIYVHLNVWGHGREEESPDRQYVASAVRYEGRDLLGRQRIWSEFRIIQADGQPIARKVLHGDDGNLDCGSWADIVWASDSSSVCFKVSHAVRTSEYVVSAFAFMSGWSSRCSVTE